MIKIIRYPLWLLWRLWFYCLFTISILLVAPFMLLFIFHDQFYKIFYKLGRTWGKIVLYGMGFYAEVHKMQEVVPQKSYMFIANHTSMIDVMLMLVVVKTPLVFVGKEELTKIPIFGFFFKRSSITVNRGCAQSRKEVYFKAQERLSNGLSICIFPEGLVPSDENVVLSEFKNGAFRLAIEHQIPIIPMTFYDCKKRFSYTFFSGSPGKMRIKIHPFISTEKCTLKDKNSLKKQAFDLIYNELLNNTNNNN